MEKEGVKLYLFLILFIFLIGFCSSIPQTFSIQGKLTNSAGAVSHGTYNMNFSIYDNSTSGNLLWSRNYSVTTNSNGIYNIILSEINLNFSEQYYLGIAVGSDSEMTPRINLTSSPYSFRANITDNLDVSKNYSLGERLTFKFGEFIDNVAGFLRISGGFNIVNSSNNSQSYFFVNGTTGNVGIGTTNPERALHIVSTQSSISQDRYSNTANAGAGIVMRRARGEIFSPLVVTDDDLLSSLSWQGWSSNANDFLDASSISARIDGTPDSNGDTSDMPGKIEFRTTPDGSSTNEIRMIIKNDGNVGIGTASPSAKLEINGTLNVSGSSVMSNVSFNGGWSNGGVSITDGNLFAQTVYVYNLSSLNVNTLNVNGSMVPATGFDNNFDIGNLSLRWRNIYLAGGIYTGENNFSINNSNFFVNTNTGNVGIGTTSPASKLHINSTGTLTSGLKIGSTGGIYADSNNWIHLTNEAGTDTFTLFSTYARADNNLIVANYLRGDGGNTPVKIDTGLNVITGNVGIGTTSPTEKLFVNGSLRIDNSTGSPILFINSTSGQVGYGTTLIYNKVSYVYNGNVEGAFDMRNSGNNGYYTHTFGVNAGIDPFFYIYDRGQIVDVLFSTEYDSYYNGNGEFGIGTTSPTAKLQVDNVASSPSINGTAVAKFRSSSTSVALTQGAITGSPWTWWMQVGDTSDGVTSYPLSLNPNGGNVGIGTTEPTSKLHINDTTGDVTPLYIYANDVESFKFRSASATNNAIYAGGEIVAQYASGEAYYGSSASKINFRTNGSTAKMVIDSSGNVGIGTTSPSEKLQVAGNMFLQNDSDKLYFGQAKDVSINYNGSQTQLTNEVGSGDWVFNSGNVGIGTTSPGISTFTGRTYLTIKGRTGSGVVELATAQADASGVLVGVLQYVDINSTSAEKRVAAVASLLSGSTENNRGGVLSFYTKADNASSLSEKMRIDNIGNVGIGTLSPTHKLNVVGDANITGNITSSYFIGDGSLLTGISGMNYTNLALTNQTNNFLGGNFIINNSVLFVNSTSGNVGIGTTSPTEKLFVNGSLRIQNSSGTLALYVNESTGNVGIGTSSPLTKLHITGTGSGDSTWTQGILVENNNATGSVGESSVSFKNVLTGSNYWFTGLNQAGNYSFAYGDSFTNANTQVVITSTGNVGIGMKNSISPTSRLHIYENEVWDSLNYLVAIDNHDGTPTEGNTLLIRGGSNSASSNILSVEDWSARSRLIVRGDGKVGINTTSPTHALNVVGGINATQNSVFGQNITVQDCIIFASGGKICSGS